AEVREALDALATERRKTLHTRVQTRRADSPLPAPHPRHTLPRLLTSCIGREREVLELPPLLANVPLVTLTGSGGVGKTRLAQELLHAAVDSYPDGIWFVQLAGLTEPALLPSTVAAGRALTNFPASNVPKPLFESLSDKHALLVLDNCEPLIDACARLAADLLGRAPRLHVPPTSREPLAIAGEVIR